MQLAAELENLGVTVYDHLEGSRVPWSPEYMQGKSSGKANTVVWVTVASHARTWLEGQRSVLFSMWETKHLPESFRETFHEFDTIIVPSAQNLELFSEYHPDVHHVPLGVDPARWFPMARKEPTSEFRYLIGGSGERKGVDLVFKAFRKLWGKPGSWGNGPIPVLQVKSPKGGVLYGERVSIISGFVSDAEEVDLYSQAHCYVQPSRGEGFGLQPLQAIVQGCPTILTDAHGHAAFAEYGIGIGSDDHKAGYFISGDAGDWWEPNFDELCDQMRDVYVNWEAHELRARENAPVAAERFTWAKTAQGVIDAIGPEHLGPYTGSGEFTVVKENLYKIITRIDWACEVADRLLTFQAGKEYWEHAEVKRILFEAGLLDPQCLLDDMVEKNGLTPEQAKNLGKYRAIYENCLFCGQSLATAKSAGQQLMDDEAAV